MNIFGSLPLEVRHIIYSFVFPELGRTRPCSVSVFRVWAPAFSRCESPRQCRLLQRHYRVGGDLRDESSLQWIQHLKALSLCCHLFYEDLVQWVYARCKFRFQHLPDAFKFFVPFYLARFNIKNVDFDQIDGNGKWVRNTSGHSGMNMTDPIALLPGLSELKLTVLINKGDKVTRTRWRMSDLRVISTILLGHAGFDKAVGLYMRCIGAVRLIPHSGHLKEEEQVVDVDGLLRAYDTRVEGQQSHRLERKKRLQQKRRRQYW